jgi:hypothetical protein
MVAHPFFCLKIGHFKAMVRTVAHPSMKKQVLQIQQILLGLGISFPNFGISRKVPWHIVLRRPRYAKVAQTMV